MGWGKGPELPFKNLRSSFSSNTRGSKIFLVASHRISSSLTLARREFKRQKSDSNAVTIFPVPIINTLSPSCIFQVATWVPALTSHSNILWPGSISPVSLSIPFWLRCFITTKMKNSCLRHIPGLQSVLLLHIKELGSQVFTWLLSYRSIIFKCFDIIFIQSIMECDIWRWDLYKGAQVKAWA